LDTLRIWAQVIVRVSRAVCTLSTASRDFSRAMRLADEVAMCCMPRWNVCASPSSATLRITMAMRASMSVKPASRREMVG
jgi:hypothetical protein